MAALTAGKKAPEFQLPTMSGGQFSLSTALERGPVVAVFFKISCPVCQFALPYVERIYKAAKGKDVTIVGVSQNSRKDTEFFARQFGITFPIALDDSSRYEVSNAFGLTNVPTIFYVNEDGNIEISSVGWSKEDVEEIARKVSERTKLSIITVVSPGEDVPAYRAG